jgi:hypothetical protein
MNTAGYRPVFLGVAKGLLKLAVLLGGLWLIVRFFGQGLGAVAYQEMPVLGSRLSVWIAAQLHLLFAAFVLGVPIFAVIVEVVGVVTKDERYDRLAHEFTRLLALAFTITAVLGCLLFLGLYFLYPQFFKFMTGIFKPTYYFYVSLLAGEVVYAYLYYYSWNVLSGSTFNKLLHIVIGILLNLFGTLIMFTADAWASFMMSPAGVYETGHLMDLWKSINNFTWMPLNIHRLLANVAFGGFIAGAYAAIKYLMTEDPAQKAHYDWMGYTGNFIGALAMIPLPFAGYWLAREVYIYNQTIHRAGRAHRRDLHLDQLLLLDRHVPRKRRRAVRESSGLDAGADRDLRRHLDDAAQPSDVQPRARPGGGAVPSARRRLGRHVREKHRREPHHSHHVHFVPPLPAGG